MTGVSMLIGKCNAREIVKSLILTLKIDREILGLSWAFEISKLTTSDSLSPTRPHLLILSNVIPLWLSIQISNKFMEAILIQTTIGMLAQLVKMLNQKPLRTKKLRNSGTK